jgi:hypothetical protein
MHAASAWLGLLFAASVALSPIARAESAPNAAGVKPGTRETLERAVQAEFQASAQSLRERLARASEGDTLGVAVANQSLNEHRARYLDLKRALARLLQTPPSAAAERNPFEPDFLKPHEAVAKTAPPPSGNTWDHYTPMALAERLSTASPVPSSTRTWGMYGAVASAHANTGPAPEVSNALTPTAAQPFLVYRASEPEDPRMP